jgi:hypothetical protein
LSRRFAQRERQQPSATLDVDPSVRAGGAEFAEHVILIDEPPAIDGDDPIAIHEAGGLRRRVTRYPDDDGAGWFARIGPRAEPPAAALERFGHTPLEPALRRR